MPTPPDETLPTWWTAAPDATPVELAEERAKRKAAQWGVSTSVLWNTIVKVVYGRPR